MCADVYINTDTGASCNFCGKLNPKNVILCNKCGKEYCPDCISDTAPTMTFESSGLGRGFYCYKCIDDVIRENADPSILSIFSGLIFKFFKVFGVLFNKFKLKKIFKFNGVGIINLWGIKWFFKKLSRIFSFYQPIWVSFEKKDKLNIGVYFVGILISLFFINNLLLFPFIKFLDTVFLWAKYLILGVYLYFLDSFIISKDSQGYARKLFCNKFYFRWIFLGLMIYTTYLFGILFDFNLQTVLTKLNVSSVDGGGILNNYLDGISDFLKNSKNNIINNPFF